MKTLKVRVELTEEMLGTSSSNPDIHREFVASKAPDAKSTEEEVAALGVEGFIEKNMTVFPKENGVPFLWDYQVKGFFKDTCSALSRVPDTRSNKLKAFRKVIDGLVFPKPRKILLHVPESAKTGECQRPLRAATAQGERVCLANSETVPAGTWFECEILILDDGLEKTVLEWLDYAALRGFGQWRSSGKGRATYQVIKATE